MSEVVEQNQCQCLVGLNKMQVSAEKQIFITALVFNNVVSIVSYMIQAVVAV